MKRTAAALLRWPVIIGLWLVLAALTLPALILQVLAGLSLRSVEALADLIAEVRG